VQIHFLIVLSQNNIYYIIILLLIQAEVFYLVNTVKL